MKKRRVAGEAVLPHLLVRADGVPARFAEALAAFDPVVVEEQAVMVVIAEDRLGACYLDDVALSLGSRHCLRLLDCMAALPQGVVFVCDPAGAGRDAAWQLQLSLAASRSSLKILEVASAEQAAAVAERMRKAMVTARQPGQDAPSTQRALQCIAGVSSQRAAALAQTHSLADVAAADEAALKARVGPAAASAVQQFLSRATSEL